VEAFFPLPAPGWGLAEGEELPSSRVFFEDEAVELGFFPLFLWYCPPGNMTKEREREKKKKKKKKKKSKGRNKEPSRTIVTTQSTPR